MISVPGAGGNSYISTDVSETQDVKGKNRRYSRRLDGKLPSVQTNTDTLGQQFSLQDTDRVAHAHTFSVLTPCLSTTLNLSLFKLAVLS